MLFSLRPCHHIPLRRFLCRSSAPDLAHYRESFAHRMAMAGIEPHHRIAIGVSGGPDSMALCALTSKWKKDHSGCVDGLVGVVVDHRLRPESAEEAHLVRERVMKIGIRCEIKCCDWCSGKPKQGHLQEAARDMRYQIFKDVCVEQKIGILLIAQHADDQAELFILRLSRRSGVFGLAGMPFVSQLFPTFSTCNSEGNQNVLLVRPMLDFSKDDMYNICRGSCVEWVEDPTNQSALYARNRLRMSLNSISSIGFRSELKRLIGACRLTRMFVENKCREMIEYSVTTTNHGYAFIDLEKLKPSKVEDIYLSKFLMMILQFISQRNKPIRGHVIKLLLSYIRSFPCKTSLAVAGCHLCPSPGSKGTKLLVCCSPDTIHSFLPFSFKSSESDSLSIRNNDIIENARSHSDKSILEASDIYFLQSKSSGEILSEAREKNIISESTLKIIELLESEENTNFTSKTEVSRDQDSRHGNRELGVSSWLLHYGQSCHFMERFLVTWKHQKDIKEHGQQSSDDQDHICDLCMNKDKPVSVCNMVDADWLYLAELTRRQSLEDDHDGAGVSTGSIHSLKYTQLSAQKALQLLKSIPVSARKSLPVIVNSENVPLSIPSICFSRCPLLPVEVIFKPRVPLGRGYTSYI